MEGSSGRETLRMLGREEEQQLRCERLGAGSRDSRREHRREDTVASRRWR